LTNKQGAVVLVVFAALFAWNYYRVQKEAPHAVIEPLKTALAAEYAREVMPALEAAMDANNRGEAVKRSETMLATMEGVEIVSVSARGTGDEICIRAEIRVSGSDPPDGRRVRYFEFSRSSLLGWVYCGPSSALQYYTTFL
jgi:hypothetical protein